MGFLGPPPEVTNRAKEAYHHETPSTPTAGGCPSCGRHNALDVRICEACGFELIAPSPPGLMRRMFRRLLRRA